MSGPSPLYDETAPPFAEGAALQGAQRTDIAIVGAGITGLSAALHLAQLGRDVTVLDARSIGWGASGRNGGQVNPGLKPDPDEVVRRFGAEAGERLVQAAWSAPELVFELVRRHAICCEAVQGGTLRAAVAERDVPGLTSLAGQCARRGMDVALLDADATAAVTGTGLYRVALLDRRGGQLNPLAYARGLAGAAHARGARLHPDSPAVRLSRDGGGWHIDTPGGRLAAGPVVLAGNGYTDGIWPRLARSIVPAYSAIIASGVLEPEQRSRILAGHQVLYELGQVTTYTRVDQAGRLLIGGRSRSRDLDGPEALGFLARHALRLWPFLEGTRWTHGWNGQLAMTGDHYPHLHEPAAGVIAGLGYNGRGVAMATLLGRELARRASGVPAQELLLPPVPITPIPLQPAWKLGVAWHIAQGRALDALHRRTRRHTDIASHAGAHP